MPKKSKTDIMITIMNFLSIGVIIVIAVIVYYEAKHLMLK
jgi:hypothetical protein